jgi:hypothetical protein
MIYIKNVISIFNNFEDKSLQFLKHYMNSLHFLRIFSTNMNYQNDFQEKLLKIAFDLK